MISRLGLAWMVVTLLLVFQTISQPLSFAADAAPARSPIYVIDLASLHQLDLKDPAQARRAWDTLHLVSSIQGIVNRESATLFVRSMPHPDDFWFNYLREPGHWLAGRPIVKINTPLQLLRTFQPKLKGIVLYNEQVAATSNLASTIAGVEDRICLRFDPAAGSLYRQVMSMNLRLGDTLKLFNDDGSPLFTGRGVIPGTDQPSTGSAKCDAYLWAKHRYMDSNRCSAEYMAYYIDTYWLTDPANSGLSNSTLTNHDFYIAKRAFFFDLGMWADETPVDDRNQKLGTDVATLKTLLRTMHDRAAGKILNIGGFVPWAWKYTNHGNAGGKRDGVPCEWEYGRIISAYGGIMDADALGYSGMSNASFYQHFPLKDHYPQNPKPTIDDLKRAGFITPQGGVAPFAYVTFYMGDYDSAAWLSYHVPLWWKDPNHGQITCAWAINPNLDRRAPHVLDYVRTHQAASDWFISGDNGAGYLNPGMLTAPRLDPQVPDGWNSWVQHNTAYFKRYDLSITGFVIDGFAPNMGERGLDEYMKFSPDGLVFQHPRPAGLHKKTLPYVAMATDLDGDPKDAGPRIVSLIGQKTPCFLSIRTILKSPTWHKRTIDAALQTPGGQQLRFVDPYTFFLLVKQSQQ